SFHSGDYVFLEDGAVLASATSGTVELSREDSIELADAVPDDDILIDRTDLNEEHVHSELDFHFVDRDATFLNGGFPANFDGRVNCIPPTTSSRTPTMMCAAAVLSFDRNSQTRCQSCRLSVAEETRRLRSLRARCTGLEVGEAHGSRGVVSLPNWWLRPGCRQLRSDNGAGRS